MLKHVCIDDSQILITITTGVVKTASADELKHMFLLISKEFTIKNGLFLMKRKY